MLWGAKIGKSYALNTKITFILFCYLTSFNPFLSVFKNRRKSPLLKYRVFGPKITFFKKCKSYKI